MVILMSVPSSPSLPLPRVQEIWHPSPWGNGVIQRSGVNLYSVSLRLVRSPYDPEPPPGPWWPGDDHTVVSQGLGQLPVQADVLAPGGDGPHRGEVVPGTPGGVATPKIPAPRDDEPSLLRVLRQSCHESFLVIKTKASKVPIQVPV